LIVFGNIYSNKEGAQRFNIVGIYEEGVLKSIGKDQRLEMFPGSGNIYVPPGFRTSNPGQYNLYEVIESRTYDPNKSSSLKYQLDSEVIDIYVYEIIDIDWKLKDEQLGEKLKEGFCLSYEPLPNVLLRTLDDFLIGPLKLKKNDKEKWEMGSTDLTPYINNNFSFLRYENKYINEPERFFIVSNSNIANEMILGYVDLASNERIIRDVLKLLRNNADVSGLTRKIIGILGEMANTIYANDGLFTRQRIQRAMQILSNVTIDESTLLDTQKILFELPYFKARFEQEFESYREQYRSKLESEYVDILKKRNHIKNELEKMSKELELRLRERDKVENILNQINDKIEVKLADFQAYAMDQFINLLPWMGIRNSEVSATRTVSDHIKEDSTLFSVTTSKNHPILQGLQEYWSCIEMSVRIPEYRLLAQTLLCAIAKDVPVLITGEQSIDFAHCLAYSISANETLFVLPEIHTFTLEKLVNLFDKYHDADLVKTLILHNAHLTSAESSLPSFLKLKRWLSAKNTPELVFLTIDEPEMAEEFIIKFPLSPVLNTETLLKGKSGRLLIPPEKKGQLNLAILEAMYFEQSEDDLTLLDDWLLDNHEMELGPKKRDFNVWLDYLRLACDDANVRYQWMWQLFEQYWKFLDRKSDGK